LHNNLKSPLSSGFFVGQYFCKSIEFQGFDQIAAELLRSNLCGLSRLTDRAPPGMLLENASREARGA
jgi:hypothetical protein